MSSLIESINPPGMDRPNRGGLFKTIGRISDVINRDITLTLRSFFPLLSLFDKTKEHGVSLGINMLPNETESDYRNRVSSGALWISNQGLRWQIINILNCYVFGRYSLFETPKMSFKLGSSAIGASSLINGYRFVLKVRDLTAQEETVLFEVLDNLLDPDIKISIVPFITYTSSPINWDLLALYGGGLWLERQLESICKTSCFILPKDGFRLNKSKLGKAILYGRNEPIIIVVLKAEVKGK